MAVLAQTCRRSPEKSSLRRRLRGPRGPQKGLRGAARANAARRWGLGIWWSTLKRDHNRARGSACAMRGRQPWQGRQRFVGVDSRAGSDWEVEACGNRALMYQGSSCAHAAETDLKTKSKSKSSPPTTKWRPPHHASSPSACRRPARTRRVRRSSPPRRRSSPAARRSRRPRRRAAALRRHRCRRPPA